LLVFIKKFITYLRKKKIKFLLFLLFSLSLFFLQNPLSLINEFLTDNINEPELKSKQADKVTTNPQTKNNNNFSIIQICGIILLIIFGGIFIIYLYPIIFQPYKPPINPKINIYKFVSFYAGFCPDNLINFVNNFYYVKYYSFIYNDHYFYFKLTPDQFEYVSNIIINKMAKSKLN
jgi:hypothetical protein